MFKEIPQKYRPIPFWSWNEKLCPEETRNQVRLMNDAGIGGYFMHARGGLQTEYMGEEWFDNVEAAISEGEALGMRPWAYDEDGWPSGFGNGKVNGLGIKYQQKYLRMEDTLSHKETHIVKSGNKYFYYDVNPFYVDTLDAEVIKEFLKTAYDPYYEKYKNRLEGFFTDEPQISRDGIPWSFVFEKEYAKRYNENILDHLTELFLPVDDYKNIRFKFWKMVTDLFSSAYMKQIYDWCDERGLKLTGHLVCEDTLLSQLACNGACMAHYEYFHIPGMDWLGNRVSDDPIALQVSSVAEQFDKEAVLTESFAGCGHNVSFDELKGICEWQMVRGINLLCQHLEGYSIRGIRKRDYPPAVYNQQPWWDNYRIFNDSMSRVGMILNQGKKKTDTLLIHPMTSAWILFDGNEYDNPAIDELHNDFVKTIKTLEGKHIIFHLGDETIMERHAYVKDGCLVIGSQSYSKIVLPRHEILFPSTEALLKEFAESGGLIVSAEDLPENPVIDSKEIAYTKREFDGFNVHYFVNSSKNTITTKVNICGEVLDIITGDTHPFGKKHVFEPWGSLMLVEKPESKPLQTDEKFDIIPLDGEFRVADGTMNMLTLDKCDYYFDGKLCEKNGYVINICERANLLGRKVQIHQDYFVNASYIPEKLYLVCETPEKFKITVNGTPLEIKPCGTVIDKSFKMLDISGLLKLGKNQISFDIDFLQSEKFYADLEKSFKFESEKNKLSYDIEIEAIYLYGEFGVKTPGKWETFDDTIERYIGEFEISEPPKTINIADIQRQGFPFFCGKLTLTKNINVTNSHTKLSFKKKGVNVIEACMQGKKQTVLWGDNAIDISDIAKTGDNTLTLTLTNNLRNLLGPHHLKDGNPWFTGPHTFMKEDGLWNPEATKQWDEDYCFAKFGLYL